MKRVGDVVRLEVCSSPFIFRYVEERHLFFCCVSFDDFVSLASATERAAKQGCRLLFRRVKSHARTICRLWIALLQWSSRAHDRLWLPHETLRLVVSFLFFFIPSLFFFLAHRCEWKWDPWRYSLGPHFLCVFLFLFRFFLFLFVFLLPPSFLVDLAIISGSPFWTRVFYLR